MTDNEQPVKLAPILLISSVAAIGGLLFGFDSGSINGTVSALQDALGESATRYSGSTSLRC